MCLEHTETTLKKINTIQIKINRKEYTIHSQAQLYFKCTRKKQRRINSGNLSKLQAVKILLALQNTSQTLYLDSNERIIIPLDYRTLTSNPSSYELNRHSHKKALLSKSTAVCYWLYKERNRIQYIMILKLTVFSTFQITPCSTPNYKISQ